MIGTDMADIYAGGEHCREPKKLFRVHKALLWSKIPYFDKMFTGGFKEAIENVANMPEDHPQSFDVLNQWLYTGVLPPLKCSVVENKIIGENWPPCGLYMLVDRLCLFQLRDSVMDAFLDAIKQMKGLPSCELMELYWILSGEGSPLRKLVLLTTCWIIHGMERNDATLRKWPASEFQKLLAIEELRLQYLQLSRSQPLGKPFEDPRTMSRCTFHHHTKDE
jgi:BTB/POZ domain